LVQKITEFQSHATGNPCSISQHAAVAALRGGSESFEMMRREYEKRRKFVLQGLETIPGFRCTQPDGAFYVFPEVAESMQKMGIARSSDYAKFLIQEARVATVPGSAFGLEGHIRLSYATSTKNIEKALERIRTAVT
jgi:aspartate aminotransferase